MQYLDQQSTMRSISVTKGNFYIFYFLEIFIYFSTPKLTPSFHKNIFFYPQEKNKNKKLIIHLLKAYRDLNL